MLQMLLLTCLPKDHGPRMTDRVILAGTVSGVHSTPAAGRMGCLHAAVAACSACAWPIPVRWPREMAKAGAACAHQVAEVLELAGCGFSPIVILANAHSWDDLHHAWPLKVMVIPGVFVACMAPSMPDHKLRHSLCGQNSPKS